MKSIIERHSNTYQIRSLCAAPQCSTDIVSYLSIAALWCADDDIADELMWLASVHQAGRNL